MVASCSSFMVLLRAEGELCLSWSPSPSPPCGAVRLNASRSSLSVPALGELSSSAGCVLQAEHPYIAACHFVLFLFQRLGRRYGQGPSSATAEHCSRSASLSQRRQITPTI